MSAQPQIVVVREPMVAVAPTFRRFPPQPVPQVIHVARSPDEVTQPPLTVCRYY